MIHLLRRNNNNFTSQVASYIRRGKHRPVQKLQVGQSIYDFDLRGQQYYPDFDLTHRQFVNSTKQTHFHQLQCSEQTNTLSLIFKLNKKLSKPSINFALQKMLNGGSTRYPIRNLIQASKQRSFNNVAYTSTINEDYMMFNFSTPIMKDYKNLMNVYYNMLFRPLLRKEDFNELVWRYAMENSQSSFNLKKLKLRGELADSMVENDYYEENFIYREIIKNFFKIHNATICSQEQLINLTHDDLIQFYYQTIQTKNLTLINHGDMGAEYVLNLWNSMEEQRANEKDKQKQEKIFAIKSDLFSKNKLSQQQQSQQQLLNNTVTAQLPKTITFQHMKAQTILMLSFKLQNLTEEQRSFLSILSYLLFDMPQSPFMKFNTPQTPYPLLYGYKNRYFNVGMTFNDLNESEQKLTDGEKEKLMIEKEKEIFETLQEIVDKKLANSLIEKCLAHLESNYYTDNGLKIIESIIDPILTNQSLKPVLNPTSIIQKLFKRYRKDNIFEKLIQKFLLNNKSYICFRGYNNYEVVENKEFQRQKKLNQVQKRLSDQIVQKIINYQPPNVLQNFKVLPELQPIDLEFFEDKEPIVMKIDGVKVFYDKRHNGVKVTLKSDISDLDQQLFPFLQLFCKSFPQMGTKLMKDTAYQEILSRYVNNLELKYQTQKSLTNPDQMKVYLFMTIEFNDRYFQYGFSLLNGLVKGWNHNNIFALSKVIQKSASQCFHEISQDLISFHAKHLAASKSPFAFFQSPIFNSRSITGMAGDLRKVTNPKQILNGISYQLLAIYQQVFQKPRVELMFECKEDKKDFYTRYLTIMVKDLTKTQYQGNIQGISIENFPQQRWLKYFPNFQRQIVFECFKFPYYEKKSSASLIFSSIVNRNILQYNKMGGCFLYKGTLVAFMNGGRKKVLELEDYYRRVNDIDEAKRSIFKRFGRYSVKNYFESGITFQEARFFKQAIIATQKQEVQQILNEFILEPLKKGQSSILSLGPSIENYEPLLKKGWEIERPVDDLSLNVESYSTNQPALRIEDYTRIC